SESGSRSRFWRPPAPPASSSRTLPLCGHESGGLRSCPASHLSSRSRRPPPAGLSPLLSLPFCRGSLPGRDPGHKSPRFAWLDLGMRILQWGLVVALVASLSAILIFIVGVPNSDFGCSFPLSALSLSLFSAADSFGSLPNEDLKALLSLQSSFAKCVKTNGLGLQAASGRDCCQVTMIFPEDTMPMWRDPKSGELEGLSFDFNLCEAILAWEQVRNSSTILTKEFIDALPNGWEDYAWQRINKGITLSDCSAFAAPTGTAAIGAFAASNKANCASTGDATRASATGASMSTSPSSQSHVENPWKFLLYVCRGFPQLMPSNHCQNRTLCMEKLALVLPETPPLMPRQFGRCAVIGNSGDLLKTEFGEEIDGYDAVIRENGAPIQNYTKYVGRKSTFRLLNRGSAKAIDKVVELDETGQEALIIKTTIHDIMNNVIKELPIKNPVYLFLGASFGSAAKGTGLKALEFALSICDSVDMYGFTVDPGYKEWTRYFSESRQGHTPLHGRAYYQMMECLGLVKIHSPMRPDLDRVVQWLPSQSLIHSARIASEKFFRSRAGGPRSSCSITKKRRRGKTWSGAAVRKEAMEHLAYVNGVTMYPLEHSPEHGMLCMVP
ncbi:hypothetical protein Taro_037576, partial [Colocasia esculenta]|nr:hypothetical protein [Colocasia esculenta]